LSIPGVQDDLLINFDSAGLALANELHSSGYLFSACIVGDYSGNDGISQDLDNALINEQ